MYLAGVLLQHAPERLLVNTLQIAVIRAQPVPFGKIHIHVRYAPGAQVAEQLPGIRRRAVK